MVVALASAVRPLRKPGGHRQADARLLPSLKPAMAAALAGVLLMTERNHAPCLAACAMRKSVIGIRADRRSCRCR